MAGWRRDIRWKTARRLCGAWPRQATRTAGRRPRRSAAWTTFEGRLVFQAGTGLTEGQLVTNGGRVLGGLRSGDDLPAGGQRAYAALDCVHFQGAQYRHRHWLAPWSAHDLCIPGRRRGYRGRQPRRRADGRGGASRTYGPEVLAGIGAFGGQFDAAALKGMDSAGAGGLHRRRRHQGAAGRRAPAGTRGWGTTSSTTASTISWCRARGRCSSWITWPPPGLQPGWWPSWWRHGRRLPRRPAAPCWAARRPRCPVSTRGRVRFGRHHRRCRWNARTCSRARTLRAGDVLVGLRSKGPHTNGYSLCADLCGVPARDRLPRVGLPLADALLARTAPTTPLTRRQSSRLWPTSPAAVSLKIFPASCPTAWAP